MTTTRKPKRGKAETKRRAPVAERARSGERWNLRLFVAGQTPRSTAALANLKKLCDEHMPGRYVIEVIDLLKRPELAREHQILAIPTLVRELPMPVKKIIGDLSNTERALVGLDVQRVG